MKARFVVAGRKYGENAEHMCTARRCEAMVYADQLCQKHHVWWVSAGRPELIPGSVVDADNPMNLLPGGLSSDKGLFREIAELANAAEGEYQRARALPVHDTAAVSEFSARVRAMLGIIEQRERASIAAHQAEIDRFLEKWQTVERPLVAALAFLAPYIPGVAPVPAHAPGVDPERGNVITFPPPSRAESEAPAELAPTSSGFPTRQARHTKRPGRPRGRKNKR